MLDSAYKMYATGDFIETSQRFDAEFWGLRTTRYMDYITNDLAKKHWNSIFAALSIYTIQVSKEEAICNITPEGPHKCVPLPPSDPPSPPHHD